MPHRAQRTIEQTKEVRGIGFLTGADVSLRFLPADEHHGIVFQRVDLPGQPRVPATIDHTVPRARRTAIACGDASIEMTEHVLAALAGMQVDNCLVQLNAPEPPGCDGSSQAFVDALLTGDFVVQTAERTLVAVDGEYRAAADDNSSEVVARPQVQDRMTVSFQLDYGINSPIPPQVLTLDISPQTFLNELAYARTFVLESEVAALKAQGYGTRVTTTDILVFGDDGVIDNRLRARDECVRHKILDCIGDFALIGCDLHGHFSAYRSGHQLNREVIRKIKAAQSDNPSADAA